jgi:hypothetical protein
MRYLIGLAAVGLFPRLGWGQGAPGTNLRVDVRVARIETRADTAHVEYIVHNHAESAEPLFEFRVEAPAAVVRVFQPQPADDWATGSVVKGISMANWGMLGTHLAAGADSPPLPFEALGLPTVVTYFATGWFPVPPYTPPLGAEPPLAPRDALLASSVQGATVGIEPFPSDLSPGALLERLDGFMNTVCGELGWVTSDEICHSLQAKLDVAGQLLSQGLFVSARGPLGAFVHELDAQRSPEPGKHVTDNGYWLLKINAEFLLSRLP